MEQKTSDAPGDLGVASIIGVLEDQLSVLDIAGFRIAAAHLDAAIQQLRLDCARRQ